MTTFTVTNTNDSGAGSLRQALADAAAASGADSIEFAATLAGGAIRLSSRLIVGAGEVNIDGDLDNNGTADITLSGDADNNGYASLGDTGILRIAAGATANIEGLILTGGVAVGANGADGVFFGDGDAGETVGGAIENFGTLSIENSVVSDSHAIGGMGGRGDYGGDLYSGGAGGSAAGGILNAGTLTVVDTYFANSTATGGDGGDGGDGPFYSGSARGGFGGRGGSASASILNLAGATASLDAVTLRGGMAVGGNGGDGGDGGYDSVSGNYFGFDGGNGGLGGSASAGVLNLGTLSGNFNANSGVTITGTGGIGGAGRFGTEGSGTNGANGLAGEANAVFINLGAGAPSISGTINPDNFTGTQQGEQYDGRDGNDTIAGLAGNDVLLGNGGNDSISGGDGNDQLSGGAGDDTIAGLAGNDVIDGGAGSDTMTGGVGNDTYFDNLGDTIAEALNAGSDTVNTERNAYALGTNLERVNFVGPGNFIGTGNALANRFQGGLGNDRFVDVLGGADIFSGGAGTDTVDFRASALGAVLNFVTNVHLGAAVGDTYSGIEKFLGSNAAADTMTAGGVGRVVYAGFGGGDTLTGGIKNDQLLGGTGDDILNGNGDRDALDGGAGNDTLTGGAEGDSFDYSAAGFGQDVITDYQDGLDRFRMSSAVADHVSDFTITGNGTTNVVMTLVADPLQTITLNGAAAITITNADFEFY